MQNYMKFSVFVLVIVVVCIDFIFAKANPSGRIGYSHSDSARNFNYGWKWLKEPSVVFDERVVQHEKSKLVSLNMNVFNDLYL